MSAAVAEEKLAPLTRTIFFVINKICGSDPHSGMFLRPYWWGVTSRFLMLFTPPLPKACKKAHAASMHAAKRAAHGNAARKRCSRLAAYMPQ